MKLSGNRLRTTSGKIIHFSSAKKRNDWENFNNMRKHNPKFKQQKHRARSAK